MDVATRFYYFDGLFRRNEVNWFKHKYMIRFSNIVIFWIRTRNFNFRMCKSLVFETQ
jgi:hypothetical protein